MWVQKENAGLTRTNISDKISWIQNILSKKGNDTTKRTSLLTGGTQQEAPTS